MVIWSYPQSRSIPTFKLHRVIVTALGANVKFFFQYISRETGYIGGIGVHFDGPGHVYFLFFWVQVGDGMKDLFFVDGRNLKIIFAGV